MNAIKRMPGQFSPTQLSGQGNSDGFRPGLTLFEALIWFFLFIGVLSAVMYQATGAIAQKDSVIELEKINGLAAAVVRTKTSSGYPASAAIGTAMDSLGIVPANITETNGTSYTNTWGGAITFTQENSGAGFTINYTNVPVSDCKLLINAMKPGIINSVGSGTYTLSLSTITAADIATMCASGTPSFSSVVLN